MRTGAVLWVALRKMTGSSNVAENRQGDPLTDVDFAKQQFGIKLTFSGNETSEAFKLLINVVFNYLFYDLNRKANDLVKTLLAEEGLLEENLSKRVKKNDTALREMMRRNKRMISSY